MPSAFLGAVVLAAALLGAPPALASEEIYLVDIERDPKTILELKEVPWSPNRVLRPTYTRPANYIAAIAFAGYGPPRFVDLAHKKLLQTDGLDERILFTYEGEIQDIAFDSRSRMFFSAIGRDAGAIYHLMVHNRRTTRVAAFPIDLIARETRGYWNGYFAFSPADRLFISVDTGGTGRSTLYEVGNGQFTERFAFDERIAGFTFVDASTIYFTNFANRLYALRNFSDVSVLHEDRPERIFNDVQVVTVPDRGTCTITGQLSGGRELWRVTTVQAVGPNVMWRTMPGCSARVDANGRYVLSNLPNGRYRVKADIGADTMAGFMPRARWVNCGTTVRNVDFRFSN